MTRDTARFITVYSHRTADSLKKCVEVIEDVNMMSIRRGLREQYGPSLTISSIRKMEDPEDEES